MEFDDYSEEPLASTYYSVDESESNVVLLVSMDRELETSITTMLQASGYVVVGVENDKKAVERLLQGNVELVLLDIRNKQTNYTELIQKSQSEPTFQHIPFVVITDISGQDAAANCIEMGAADCLFVPINRVLLNAKIHSSLKFKRQLDADSDYRLLLEAQVRLQTTAIRQTQEDVVLRLMAASESRDHETGAHIKRIGFYSAEMARWLNWPEEKVDNFRLAAAMHDIGKLGIPETILQKAGKLTPEEFAVIKEHTLIGAKLMSNTKIPLLELSAEVALSHHEKWDATGYPNRLGGNLIPITARIVAIADVYDALIHRRCYKPAWTREETLSKLMEEAGKHFDRDLVELFIKNIAVIEHIKDEFPD